MRRQANMELPHCGKVIRLGEEVMLNWAVVFLVIALIAALFGFGGIAGTAVGIAKLLFFIFLAVFVVSLIMGLAQRRTRV